MDKVLSTEVEFRRKWLQEYYGDKCLDYYEGCIVCRLWKNQEDFEAIIDVDFFNPLDYEQTK